MLPTPALIALQFLTRLPVRLPGMPKPEQIGRSLLWYPLVGVLLGGLLLALHGLLGDTPALLQAAILLAVWVGLSGGLHLDGLADTADAWIGGHADRQRTLEIMKDPRSGPIAVVVLLLVLLLKFAALVVLLGQGAWAGLLLAPWLGRALLPLLLLTTPYVRAGGLGAALAEHLPRQPLRKIWFNDAEGSRAYIQKETVEFHVGIAAAKGFLGLALHAQDFQVAHIILQVIGRILRNVIIDGGNDRGIADAEVVV